ncbi:MAG: cyclic nucleotide-binding domain-containing protein [Nitrospinaceae bacterium]|nr:cyclic nucleotide-binding domain-containing protein [Nitrospinaceae bacterium]MBT6396623.1 cyclic nucleotide-binding domain-containing protein [Nitrospinaceae bacterium]
MSNFIKRLFNVREDEFLVFISFFVFYFLIGLQFSIGLSVSEALFLSHPKVGPGFLPYMYIFNSLVIIVVSMVYGSFTDKMSIPSMFKAVLAFFIGLVFLIRLAISVDIQVMEFPIALPFLHTLFVMFTNMVPNNFRAFYGLYLDVLQSKRLVPIILTGGRYGGIVGGFSIPILVAILGNVANLLYFWIATIVASIFFITAIQVRLSNHLIDKSVAPKKKAAGKSKRQGGIALMKTNRYVAAFSIFSFLIILLRSFQDFQYSVIFREVFQDKAQLASFLGMFTGIGSAFALLVQTFITPRIIRRLGLGTANLLYPFTTLLGLGAMTLLPGFYAAVFLRFNNKNLQESIRNPINALLYNALPTNIRGRVGAFVAGQVVAIASILSGIILLVIRPTGLALFPLSPRWVAGITFFIAIGYLAAGFILRSEYSAALRKMLEERNLGLFRFAQQGFGEIDEQSMSFLVKNLHEGDDDLCVYAAGMLADTGEAKAIGFIMDEIPRRKGECLCQLLRLLAGTPDIKENERARKIWERMLNAEDDECRRATMDAIVEAGLVDDFVEEIQDSLTHDSPLVRARAIQLLVHSDDLFYLAAGLQVLHTMLEEGTQEERVCALKCIGELENPRFVKRVVPYLSNSDVAVRESAMESVERLLKDNIHEARHLDEIINLALKDSEVSIRRRGVHLLGKRGSKSDFEHLLASLSDTDVLVRNEAVNSLKEIKRRDALSLEGGALIAIFGRWLAPAQNGNSPQEVNSDELTEGLTEFSLEHLLGVYEMINHLHTIERRGVSEPYVMLHRALSDKVQERQTLILQLLGVIGDEKTVDTVSESLARGEKSSRAIAIETLSNVNAVGDMRQLILMLEPLLLDGTTVEKLNEGRKAWTLASVEFNEVLQIYVDSLDPWIRAVATDAAGHFIAEDKSASSLSKSTLGEALHRWSTHLRLLASDDDIYVREAAVGAMSQMSLHESEDKKEWIEVAANDPDERVRTQAKRAQAQIKAGGENAGGREMLSTIEKALFLKGVKLFDSMTSDQFRVLSDISSEFHFKPNTLIFEEDDPCDYLYVIVDGEVDIMKVFGKEEQKLATLGVSSSFGEIALFGDEGRTAGAKAGDTEVTLLGIEKDPLLALINKNPSISIAIIYELSSIVRTQDTARTVSTQEES